MVMVTPWQKGSVSEAGRMKKRRSRWWPSELSKPSVMDQRVACPLAKSESSEAHRCASHVSSPMRRKAANARQKAAYSVALQCDLWSKFVMESGWPRRCKHHESDVCILWALPGTVISADGNFYVLFPGWPIASWPRCSPKRPRVPHAALAGM